MAQFDNVSVSKEANVYLDGKCISHTVYLSDGIRKSVGVILPSVLTFNTGAPETMGLIKGKCRVRLDGESDWTGYEGGERFSVPGNSRFDIETIDALHYVCHFE